MSLLESMISIIVIGLIVTIFSFVPTGIMNNKHEASQIVSLSKVIEEVSYEVEEEDWTTVSDIQMRLDAMMVTVKSKIEEQADSRFELKGEVIEIDSKKFIKVTVSHGNAEQEYFYGFSEIE